MKKIATMVVIATLCLVLITSAAYAGSSRRHRLEGVAIGIGAVLLGKAIIDSAAAHHSREVIHHHTVIHRDPPRRHRVRGHWEIKQVWVPPVYKEVWKPGHYNRRGHWVEGKWVTRIKRYGYWKEKEVWVTHDRHRKGHHRSRYRHY
jgi:hypothetical protein